MIINLLYYLIFTGICLIIPGIGWLFWLGCTLLIIAYNFLITGNKSKKDKEEIERYKKELEKKHKNKDFWN
jgi:glycosyltransferase, family 2